jgi:hypothetical protein
VDCWPSMVGGTFGSVLSNPLTYQTFAIKGYLRVRLDSLI